MTTRLIGNRPLLAIWSKRDLAGNRTSRTFVLASSLVLLLACRSLLAEENRMRYEPTRESLSQHRVPEWYQDAKIGFFYHWGPQSVVGDKFAMWDSQVIDTFNAAKMGPQKDTVRLVIDAARNRGMKVGVSTHVMRHSWYYPKLEGYDTTDPRYVQLYGEGLQAGGLPKPEAIQKWEATLKGLIDAFHPDYIFSDGDTADIYCKTGSCVCVDAFRRIVAYYFNTAQTWGGEPVITFKRETLYKEEAVPDYEGGMLLDIAPYKWHKRTGKLLLLADAAGMEG